MPPVHMYKDDCKDAAEVLARAKAARARLRGEPPRPVVVERVMAPPPPPTIVAPPPPPVPELPAASIQEFPAFTARRIPIRVIVDAICERFNLTYEELTSERRHLRLTQARGVGYYIAKELTTLSYPAIARAFGRTDHSTVLVGISRVEKRLEGGPHMLATGAAIKELIGILRAKYPNAGTAPRLTREERNFNPLCPNNGKPFSRKEVELLGRLAAEGKSTTVMSVHLGRSTKTIREKAVKLGLLIREKNSHFAKMREPSKRKFWTAEHKDELRELFAAGMKTKMIAARIGRSPSAVVHMANDLGIPLPPRPGRDK